MADPKLIDQSPEPKAQSPEPRAGGWKLITGSWYAWLAALSLLYTAPLIGQQTGERASSAPASLQELLPLDPAVHAGTLPNGLKYFIRENGRPAKRVSLRLAVKAGSINEADDQQGLAHLIEHLAFNGSTHFRPGELFAYFESVGARIGPHVNAYTSFDETVYTLDLPTSQADVITKGLTALADVAGGLTFDPQQVDKERGVVIEEWRGGLGASSRVRDKQLPILFYQSRYADRLPIGKPEIVRSTPVERLRTFYDTWYRPDRMAVIAVGDFDSSTIEAEIRSAFTSLQARRAAAPEPDTSIPLHHPLLVSVVTDPELTVSTVQVLRKRPKERLLDVGDYRRDLLRRMVAEMMNDRFSELARKSEARFLGASTRDGALTRTVAAFVIEAGVQEGRLEDGVGVVAAEAKRVREYGFNPSELDRAKRWVAAFYERAFNEHDKSDSGLFAQGYLAYFLDDEPSPGIEHEYRLVQQLLPGITVEEASATARHLLGDDSRILIAVSPQKADISIPSEAELRQALAAAEHASVTAWDDTEIARELMEVKPRPGSVLSRGEIRDLGITTVKFANGVEAWLKPTDFKNDQVLFTFSAKGGASLAPPADYLEASLAAGYVRLSGAGGLRRADLQKLLAGKIAVAAPFVQLSTHGILGSAAPADLETALQLLHQSFVAPGDDPEAFALMKRQLGAAVASRDNSPGDAFSERVAEVNASNHYTAQQVTAERVAALSREKMVAFYRERFANAADFTLFMVGAFTLEDAMPLLARYLGSLPSAGVRMSDFKDVGLRFPDSVQRALVERGREPRSETVISFFAEPPPTTVEREKVVEATMVLQMALQDILRKDLGQTYTVSVRLSQSLPQRGSGRIAISFGAAPENLPAMTERVLQEVRRLQKEGPSEEQTSRAKEAARLDYETALRQNDYWLRRLETVHVLDTDPVDIVRRRERIDAVTPHVLEETFKQYFPWDRFTIVTLVPEPGK